MPDKTVAILNLSKANRRYEVNGGEDGEGKPIKLKILPNQKAVEVPEKEAVFLLSKLPSGKPRFPDLINASEFRPEVTKQKEEALAENAKLLKENAELKAKLEEQTNVKPEKERPKGGSKK